MRHNTEDREVVRPRLASLISGGGTTMEAIVTACHSGEIPMDVACVIASNPNAGGIEKAKKLGIPDKDIVILDPTDFIDSDNKVNRLRYGQQILQELRRRDVSVVTLNGWLPLLPELIINAFPDKVFNQHPGPVPEFGGPGMYGRRVHAARLLFARTVQRDYWTEAIAQRVDPEFDKGVVVKSERVEIFPGDTVDLLQQRVLPFEHQVQIALLKDVAAGTVRKVATRKSLVLPAEIETILLVKKMAKLLYPHG